MRIRSIKEEHETNQGKSVKRTGGKRQDWARTDKNHSRQEERVTLLTRECFYINTVRVRYILTGFRGPLAHLK